MTIILRTFVKILKRKHNMKLYTIYIHQCKNKLSRYDIPFLMSDIILKITLVCAEDTYLRAVRT